jgi:plastocyanin
VGVATGTEVTWQNQDPAEHTVTADGGVFGSDALPQGQKFSTRFDTPGRFAYFCAIHPAMRGTVEVT